MKKVILIALTPLAFVTVVNAKTGIKAITTEASAEACRARFTAEIGEDRIATSAEQEESSEWSTFAIFKNAEEMRAGMEPVNFVQFCAAEGKIMGCSLVSEHSSISSEDCR